MNDRTKKRLAIAGIALTSAMLVASVGFTVAWYNGSSNLAVYNFDITLANKELTISTDNVEFKDHLTKDDIKDAIPEKYRPVSSAFSQNWLDQKATTPQFTSGYTGNDPEKVDMTSINDVGIMNQGFFQKELYLKCTSFAKVTLDVENTYINADKAANATIASKLQRKVYPDMTVEQVEEYLNRIEDSLRFSILVLNDTGSEVKDEDYKYTIVDPHKNGTTKLGGILDTDLDGYYDSYDGKEIIYGDVSNSSQAEWGDARSADEGNKGTNSCFDAAHRQGVQPLDYEESKNRGMLINEEKTLSLEELNQFTLTLQADVSKKIVLSLYIEGWDQDSVNYTMFSRFVTGISFKLADGGNGGN
jgi:hypothetical protein